MKNPGTVNGKLKVGEWWIEGGGVRFVKFKVIKLLGFKVG